MAGYRELWVCFTSPAAEPPPDVLVLSFLSPRAEAEAVHRWGGQVVSALEVADEVRAMRREQGRWIKIACAFPISGISRNRRGINKTDWIPIDRAT